MLRIRQVKHLAHRLGVSVQTLDKVAETPGRWCEERELRDPTKPTKVRNVLVISGPLRVLQTRMLRNVLMPALPVSQFNHGGIRGRHIKSNIESHLDSTFVLTMDITNFYPSISDRRVYRLFCGTFQCSPEVARICTRLCTYDRHLALGLITSPILADQMMGRVDERIGIACRRAGLLYTRYVDDLTISGRYELKASGFASLVQRILDQHGFLAKSEKTRCGRLDEDALITKIRVNRGHPDVSREYLAELQRQLADARSLANGERFEGPYFTESQIRGRVEFVCWINPGRKRTLLRAFKAIAWDRANNEAENRGLVACKRQLVKAVFADSRLGGDPLTTVENSN